MIRRQLPAYSPLSAGALWGAAWATIARRSAGVAEKLANQFPGSSMVLCDSGTSALTLALLAACRGREGALVSLPAYGCFDLATAALGGRARVTFYDIDPETLGPDLDSLAGALKAGPAAVVVAYWYGVTFDIEAVERLVGESGAVLIEDAAQAFGAVAGGRPCGTSAPLGVLSFGRGKGATGGAGGALLLNDDSYLLEAPVEVGPSWGAWLKSLAQWLLGRPLWYGLPARLPFLQLGETVYHPPATPRSMPALHQQVLARTIAAALAEVAIRRSNADRLSRLLDENGQVSRVRCGSGTPSFLRLPVLAPGGRFRSGAARDRGIMPGYPITLPQLPPLASALSSGSAERGRRYPGAERLVGQLVTLPTHSLVSEAELDRLGYWVAGEGGADTVR